MAQLRQHEPEFSQRNVAVCIVTFDAGPLAKAYAIDSQLAWPLLLDESLSLYQAYAMERAGWWTLYGPASIWQYLALLFRGRKLKKPGKDWRQLGGDVLIDPQGIVRLHYVSTSPHDRPAPQTILERVVGH